MNTPAVYYSAISAKFLTFEEAHHTYLQHFTTMMCTACQERRYADMDAVEKAINIPFEKMSRIPTFTQWINNPVLSGIWKVDYEKYLVPNQTMNDLCLLANTLGYTYNQMDTSEICLTTDKVEDDDIYFENQFNTKRDLCLNYLAIVYATTRFASPHMNISMLEKCHKPCWSITDRQLRFILTCRDAETYKNMTSK
ncbi:MAG: hypothetical protein IJ421_00020 [Prevotella sp.]|nr:hypothetical protein [Prevotella sp.]